MKKRKLERERKFEPEPKRFRYLDFYADPVQSRVFLCEFTYFVKEVNLSSSNLKKVSKISVIKWLMRYFPRKLK